MTKLEFDKLGNKTMAMRYQYMGRKTKQTGFKMIDKIHLFGIGLVSYKSVDLVK